MKFRFPLQKIVDLKKNEKTQAEWLLSQAIAKLREEQQFLLELYNEITRQHELLGRSSEVPTSVAQIQYVQDYIDHLGNQIIRKQAEVDLARTNVEGKQQTLMVKSVDEKVWKKAREKALRQFTLSSLRKEQRDLDEMATIRHVLE